MPAISHRPRATVVIRTDGITNIATGPSGAVLLRRRADEVARLARLFSATNGSIPLGIYVGPIEGKTIKVISSNPHTVLVHNGSRAHIIRPRNAKYLRFTVGGRVVYTKLVRHPGYAGNPFLKDALILSAG
jgi:hypothetical protein